jgi:aspartyl-tRNA(Asn)/glutamyl-tRNA(Gln) amidotransferase subunit C
MSEISREEVEEIALLARLRLGDDEVDRLRGELSAVLGYVEQLGELDVGGVEPMTHAVPITCPLRPDDVGASFAVDDALADAPQPIDDCFAVPRIIEVP